MCIVRVTGTLDGRYAGASVAAVAGLAGVNRSRWMRTGCWLRTTRSEPTPKSALCRNSSAAAPPVGYGRGGHRDDRAVGEVLAERIQDRPRLLGGAGERFADDHHVGRVGFGERVDDLHPVGDPAAQAGDVVPEQVGGAAFAGDQGQLVAGQQRLHRGRDHGRRVVGVHDEG
jgi:hypothetical protein